MEDVTIVFDKGNNSKDNFKLIDNEEGLHYVGGLVSSYFKDLIKEANENFTTTKIDNQGIPLTGVATTYCGFPVWLPRRPGQARHRPWALWQPLAEGAGRRVFHGSGRFDD